VPRLDTDELTVSVCGAEVTLGGKVKTTDQVNSAIRAARRIHGVRQVVRKIRVAPADFATRDESLAADALQRLVSAFGTSTGLVVRAQDRDVTVSGQLPQGGTHEAILGLLVDLPSARNIVDQTTDSLSQDQLDHELRDRITKALFDQSSAVSTSIGVAVRNGVVELGGTVGSRTERDGVLSFVSRLPGVCTLVNALRTEDEYDIGSDYNLASEVRADLIWNRAFSGCSVTAEVADGAVKLRGTVPDARLRDRVRASVSDLTGVRAVDDEIVVSAGQTEPRSLSTERSR
jgi:osmotically-inducible protein OsmY